MAKPSLTQVFGPGASQTATHLTIAKADWGAVGFTPSAVNSPESMFVAMVLFAALYLTESNLNANVEQQVSVTDGQEFVTVRSNQQYRQISKAVNMQKLYTGTNIDPDDY